ncbi:MAG TPA: hypothetical protein PKD68_03105 [Candidatus Saccharibacteria bacterium]|nr:hypothetical protein [Candidatus Saccharibacteria bacterium]
MDASSTPNPSTSDTTSVEVWFETIQPQIPEPPKRSPAKKLLIIAACGVLIIGLSTVAIFATKNSAARCLDIADYIALTGDEATDDVDAKSSFYTDYILFEPNSFEYDNTTDDGSHGAKLIQQLTNFTTARPDVSTRIVVHGNYFTQDAETRTKQAMERVAADLKQAGIDNSAIIVQVATYSEPEEESEIALEVLVTIASDETCREN